MDSILIEHLEMVARELREEVKQKKEWGHFGNSLGHSESSKLLTFWAEILMAIADNL